MSTADVFINEPRKLSSKFGASFATFEKNSDSRVPTAFQSIAKERNKKSIPKVNQQPESISKTNQTSSITLTNKTNEASKSSVTIKPKKDTVESMFHSNKNDKFVNKEDKIPPVKSNFRVSSSISNRAKLFEANSKTDRPSPDHSGKIAYLKLRRLQEASALGNKNKEFPKTTNEEDADYFEIEIEVTSPGEEENFELWEEETLESTELDDSSWDEETIESEIDVDLD
jgi:hypothetical protein